MTTYREQLAAQARLLRAQGHTREQVQGMLGVRQSYLSAVLSDPTGEKERARRDRYRKPCPQCGTLMCGSDGPNKGPKLCFTCSVKKQSDEPYWSRERIVAAFQAFTVVAGRAPTTVDTMSRSPSVRARMSPERLAEADANMALVKLPRPATVQRKFGSWATALKAAGVTQNPTGGAGHRGERYW